MSKEYLEALNIIKFNPDDVDGLQYLEAFKVVEQALQRLEAIDNAKPSEALEKLDKINNYLNDVYGYEEIEAERRKDIDFIKQSLIKAQEDEKKVEALKELFENHIELVVEKDRCYFKIKNSKGKEKSFTSYSMLDFLERGARMSKEIKLELFNIYDIVVFEDENGITQDCVCGIGKDIEADKIISTIECNSHSISIYESGNYSVWKKDGFPYYLTDKKIIHLYTLKNDNRFYEVYPTDDYKAIDQSNPSEALEKLEMLSDCAEAMKEAPSSNWIEYAETEAELDLKLHFAYLDLKQYILKSQENEKVLSIIKEKCLHTDNLNDVATCLNYNYYKERMSKKYDTKVVKTDWNDKALLDYLKLLTEEEFDLVKRLVDTINI